MASFVLVHAAWHGVWCWERLSPELERLGHRVIAVELPGADRAAGVARYADAVLSETGGADDLIPVGHSLGGITIPLVAAARPVRGLVFLAGLLPTPGRSVEEQLRDGERMLAPGVAAALEGDGEASWLRDADTAIDLMFHDCEPIDARNAAARLRPQARAPLREACPLGEWPDVESVYVVCRNDRVVPPEWGRRAARERLGVDALELPGGHSPFLSRPAELAALLDRAI